MTPNAQPAAYLRQSRSKTGRVAGPADLSRDNQLAAVTALAARDGVTIVRVYDGDWGRSGGRKKLDKRQDMAALMASIRAGEVSAVYAYKTNRLNRDSGSSAALWSACEDAGGTTIVTGERTYDTTNGTDKLLYSILAAVDEFALDDLTYTNRSIKNVAREHAATCPLPGRPHWGRCADQEVPCVGHCARSHGLGGKLVYGSDPRHPSEDAAVVVAAYREAGSFLGAARALTAAGVPTRHGGRWTARSAAVLVRREAPELAPLALARKGVSAKRTRLFSGLLACGGCGSIMTSMPRPGRKRVDGSLGPGSISYYCRAEIRDARHAPPYMVSERKVLAWAKVETQRAPGVLQIPAETGRRDPVTGEPIAGGVKRVSVSLATIAAKRAAIVNLAADLTITPDEARKRLSKLDAQTKGAEAAQRAWTILGASLGIDWNREPAAVNADLRTIWAEVKLGPDMLPVRAEWIVSPYAGPDDPGPPMDDDEAAAARARDALVGA
jgi:hypothetical protein